MENAWLKPAVVEMKTSLIWMPDFVQCTRNTQRNTERKCPFSKDHRYIRMPNGVQCESGLPPSFKSTMWVRCKAWWAVAQKNFPFFILLPFLALPRSMWDFHMVKSAYLPHVFNLTILVGELWAPGSWTAYYTHTIRSPFQYTRKNRPCTSMILESCNTLNSQMVHTKLQLRL